MCRAVCFSCDCLRELFYFTDEKVETQHFDKRNFYDYYEIYSNTVKQ